MHTVLLNCPINAEIRAVDSQSDLTFCYSYDCKINSFIIRYLPVINLTCCILIIKKIFFSCVLFYFTSFYFKFVKYFTEKPFRYMK